MKKMIRKVNKFFDKKCSIVTFADTVLYLALVGNNFAEHLRKAFLKGKSGSI